MSAIKKSPPLSDGPHGGKDIGKDFVTYVFDQVSFLHFYCPCVSIDVSTTQSIPIPSYLIAIAVGNLEYKAFDKQKDESWSSGVWTEPEFLEKAHWEFSHDIPRYHLLLISTLVFIGLMS
jgi:leukotriene-A4 hydrolase